MPSDEEEWLDESDEFDSFDEFDDTFEDDEFYDSFEDEIRCLTMRCSQRMTGTTTFGAKRSDESKAYAGNAY